MTSNCSLNSPDEVNTIRFSGLLNAGVLGVTCTIFTSPTNGISRMVEFDMQISTTMDWSVNTPTPSNRYDLYTVLVHEFGHALGLGHSSNGTVMQQLLGQGDQMRTLQADDIAGLRKLYGVEAAPTATSTAPAQATPTKTATVAPSATPTRVPRPLVDHPFRLFAAQAAVAGTGNSAPPTATPTPTTVATVTPTATSTSTGTPQATVTATPQPATTGTPQPTATATPTSVFTPTHTATAAATAAATATQTPLTGVQTRNSSWLIAPVTGSAYVMGEVYNGTGAPIAFVEITANFYSASGQLLATDYSYADLTTIPSGSDSPFRVILFDPPEGIESVGIVVTDYSTNLYFPVVSGLTLEVTNTYTTSIDTLHIVGTVKNNSGTTWDYVQPIVALYDETGRVIKTDFTFTEPGTLAPGASGTFDLLIFNGASLESAPKRFWIDALAQ